MTQLWIHVKTDNSGKNEGTLRAGSYRIVHDITCVHRVNSCACVCGRRGLGRVGWGEGIHPCHPLECRVRLRYKQNRRDAQETSSLYSYILFWLVYVTNYSLDCRHLHTVHCVQVYTSLWVSHPPTTRPPASISWYTLPNSWGSY